MANISDFKSQMLGGGARPNQFQVFLTFPAFVGIGNIVGNQARFLCKAAALPESNIENIPVQYRGRAVNFAGEKTFQPWSVSIYNDTSFSIRNAMEVWSNGIQNNGDTLGLTNPRDYQVDLIVEQLDRNGAVVKAYTFHDAYPTSVGTIGLDYETNNQIETFETVFTYNYWVSNTTPAVGASTGLGIGPIPV
jgi:hypothetical protein